MDSQIPSLQQYCYDLLAEYAGYIQDLDGLHTTSIREISLRTNPFGLANIESLIDNSIDLTSIWENFYKASPEMFQTSLSQLVQGPDFCRQVVLCSTLNNLLSGEQIMDDEEAMDDEDLQMFLSLCAGLKIVEIKKINRLGPEIVLSCFGNLVHLDLSESKIGPGAGVSLNGLICVNQCLQTMNLRNCVLEDFGLQVCLNAIQNSKLTNLDLSWNNLTMEILVQVCEIIQFHGYLSIINLSNNVGRVHIVQLKKLTNKIRALKKISIT